VDLLNPQQASNGGNAYPGVTTLTAYESWHWEYAKDVDGNIYGQVRVPENLAGTPAASIVIEIAANATSGVSRLQVLTKAVSDGQSINPSSLVAESVQDVTVPATAYLRKKLTFTLTNAPAAGDILLVQVYHNGAHANDSLAVNTLLLGAWLVCDVT
jgi:hypothetical protein